MKLDYLIEEEDREKLLLARYLEFEKKNYVVLPKLYETLGLSKFKTRNYIIELNKEFTEFKTKPEIQISEEAEIHVERLNLTDIKNLRRIYFQRSKIARLLTEIVDSKVTIEKFAENHFLSISRAYVKRRELVSFLEQHQIKLKKNILVGEEINIRNVLFGVYFGVFNGFSMPFRESVMNEAKSIVQYFEYLFNLKLSATKRIKFNLLTTISLLRAYGNQPIGKRFFSDEYFKSSEGMKIIKDLSHISFLHIPKEQIIDEISYIMLFLITEEEFELDGAFGLAEAHFHDIHMISQKMSVELIDQLPFSIEISEEERLYIRKELRMGMMHVNRKNWIFDFEMTSFTSKKQLQFFFETYPIFSTAIQKVIQENKRYLLGKDERFMIRLFYDYLFLLVGICPVSYFEAPIHVCIDFSQGSAYTDYIISQVKGFKNYNIVIESRITSRTNIYLSDCLLEKFNKEQIIWKNPSTPDDWEYFGNTIIREKNRHLTEKIS
ncbi:MULTISPECIES: helix-turn-helix domain-containing protein [Enterococcus]|uniref:helix-turn-helix domain-containing protein n=1 Tax=Enterococcus TaxID=1350 RepID=UPI000CF2D1A0|nr:MULTISPECIES: helix-turn-helix domain-containing protein [Enterococcus]PQF04611.1 M protein trans-acting positive regulator [Enterococcus faecium]